MPTVLEIEGYSSLQLKVFISDGDKCEKGMYLKDYEVDINKPRKVPSDKYLNLESYLVRKIKLHVFTDEGYSGLTLTPLDIQKYARLVFSKRGDKVHAEGTTTAHTNHRFWRREAHPETTERGVTVGSYEEAYPEGLGSQSEERTPTDEKMSQVEKRPEGRVCSPTRRDKTGTDVSGRPESDIAAADVPTHEVSSPSIRLDGDKV